MHHHRNQCWKTRHDDPHMPEQETPKDLIRVWLNHKCQLTLNFAMLGQRQVIADQVWWLYAYQMEFLKDSVMNHYRFCSRFGSLSRWLSFLDGL